MKTTPSVVEINKFVEKIVIYKSKDGSRIVINLITTEKKE